MASSEYACNFSAPAPVLRRLFDKAKFAISTEETRYYLNGVYLHTAQGDRAGAALRGDRRAPSGPDRRAPARRAPRDARRDRAAQDGGRVAQAAGRRRGEDRRVGVETKIRFATPWSR
jgi:DNA polymerase III subunit beta